MPEFEFPVTGPINAYVKATSGTLKIIAEDRDSAAVSVDAEHGKMFAIPSEPSRTAAENTRVTMEGDTLSVETPSVKTFGFVHKSTSVHITIRMPIGGMVNVEALSADARIDGEIAAARIHTASGDVLAGRIAGDADIQTASGDIEIESVGGDAKLHAASGDLRVRHVGGELNIRSASGDVEVGAVGGAAKVVTASGDVHVGPLRRGDAQINSASGDVRIGVAQGTAVWLDVNSISGDTSSDLDMSATPPNGEAPNLNLHVHTVSGDVHIYRAAVLAKPAPVPAVAEDPQD